MFLSQKKYNVIVSEALENDNPVRIVDHLQHYFKNNGAANPKYWQYVRDAATTLFPDFDYERTYDVKKTINDNYELHSDEEKVLFIYLYALEETDKKLESQRYDKRRYSLNDLSALVQWANKQAVDPDGIRYELSKSQINFYTNTIFQLVFEEHLLEEEALKKIEKTNLSLYIKIYFSIAVVKSQVHNTDEIILTDYRKPRLPLVYQIIGDKDKRRNYFTIYQERYSKAKLQLGLSETKFKNVDATRWRTIKRLYGKSTTEFNLINQYLKYLRLPEFKINKAIAGHYSFDIDVIHRDTIIELITKINKSELFRFLSESTTPTNLADVLVATDFKKYANKPIIFRCETHLVVYVLHSLNKLSSSKQLKPGKVAESRLFKIPVSHKKPSYYTDRPDTFFQFNFLNRTNYYNHLGELTDKLKTQDELGRALRSIRQQFASFEL